MGQAKLRSEEYSLMDAEPDPELLSRYVEAFQRFDIQALVALFHEEDHMSMPPFPMWVRGKDDLFKFFSLTRWHCLAVTLGGEIYSDAVDHGFMYQWGFRDLDGHIWEFAYMDMSAFEGQGQG